MRKRIVAIVSSHLPNGQDNLNILSAHAIWSPFRGIPRVSQLFSKVQRKRFSPKKKPVIMRKNHVSFMERMWAENRNFNGPYPQSARRL